MTGDPTHDDGARTATAAESGWYADPGDPGRLRYFDGAGWTPHVAPRPVPTYPVPPGSVTTLPPTTAAAPRVTVARVLLVVSVVLVGLVMLGGGLRGLMQARTSSLDAAGPPMSLASVAPETVVGRTATRSQAADDLRRAAVTELQPGMRELPGSSAAQVEIYGPDPAGAPDRGLGILMLMWTGTSTAFDQEGYARGFAEGAVQNTGDRATTTSAADGGVVVCTETDGADGAMSLCAWIRSASGVVMLAEYDVPVDTVRTDLAAVVTQMARP